LPLADERLFRPILVVVETFKTLGIPLILVLAAISYSQARQIGMKYRILPAVRAIAAFMLIQCSTLLTTDFELIHNLLNALTLRVGETLDMYSFRSVLQMGNYSIGGALWLLKLAVQLLFALLAYVLIKRWFISDLFQSSTDSHKQQAVQGNRETIGSVPALFFAAVVLGAFVLMLIYPFMQSPAGGKSLSDAWVTGNAGLYAGVYGMAAIVSMLVMLTLAYPLTVRELPGRRVYKFLLLLVIVVGTNSLPDFLLINSMGMINTVFPSGINGLLPIVGVFVLKGIFVSNHMERKEKTREQGHGELFAFFTVFIPSIWKPLVALGVLQFASLWNSYYSSMLYVADKTKSSPIMHFQMLKFDVQQMGIQAADPVILQYGAVLILPPLLLYILFHRWMTAEVFLSQSNKL
jgi:ABC-type glycerol-3-phosphate transport system permease component